MSNMLWDAVATGDVNAVPWLLANLPVDVNERNDEGLTFLFVAAKAGKDLIVAFLLTKGADAEIKTIGGETALLAASRRGFVGVVEVLLAYNSSIVNLHARNGDSPLLEASRLGHTGVVEVLLMYGACVCQDSGNGRTSLYRAAMHGNTDVVKLLIARCGVDGDNMGYLNKCDYAGVTPILTASERGHTEVVKLLVEAGADIEEPDDRGITPLFAASWEGHVAVVKLLLESGVDVQKLDERDRTAMIAACVGGNIKVITLLINHGCDMHKATKDGKAPVYIASENGHVEAIKLLLEAGAHAKTPDNEGTSPVWIAGSQGHADAVYVLLKAGADVLSTWRGQSVLEIATKHEHDDVVRLLVEAEQWPWDMFLMGGRAGSHQQDYLAPPANRTTRNHLPRLYSNKDVVWGIWKFLY